MAATNVLDVFMGKARARKSGGSFNENAGGGSDLSEIASHEAGLEKSRGGGDATSRAGETRGEIFADPARRY